MDSDRDLRHVDPFEPLSPAPRRRVIAWSIVGPLMWLVALAVTAVTIHRTDAIGLGLLIAAASMLLSLVVLLAVHAARDRERERFASSR